MKKTVFVLGSALVLFMVACTNDNNKGIVLQAHDQNE